MPIRTLQDALAFYRDYARGVEGRSNQTIIFKETPVRQLIKFLGKDLPLAQLEESHIVGFLGWLRQRDKWAGHPSGNRAGGQVKDVSVNSYFRGLRAFLNWAEDHKLIRQNPMAGIPAPRYQEKLPRYLKQEQIQNVLRAIDLETQAGYRDATIILLLADVGLRAGELVGLALDDIDIGNRDIVVTQRKTRRQQVLSFHAKTARFLATYLSQWRPDTAYDEVFLTEDARPLTVNRLAKILRTRGDRVDIHLNPHLFRHTAAVLKRRLEQWDAERIQNLLGHTTSDMTRRYIRAAGDEDLRAAFRKPGWVDTLKLPG